MANHESTPDWMEFLVRTLTWMVALVVGFRDMNVFYLLVPIAAMTWFEILQTNKQSPYLRGMRRTIIVAGVLALCGMSYVTGRLIGLFGMQI
jgi:hypothetical protein